MTWGLAPSLPAGGAHRERRRLCELDAYAAQQQLTRRHVPTSSCTQDAFSKTVPIWTAVLNSACAPASSRTLGCPDSKEAGQTATDRTAGGTQQERDSPQAGREGNAPGEDAHALCSTSRSTDRICAFGGRVRMHVAIDEIRDQLDCCTHAC